jgi:hypothetical protein
MPPRYRRGTARPGTWLPSIRLPREIEQGISDLVFGAYAESGFEMRATPFGVGFNNGVKLWTPKD